MSPDYTVDSVTTTSVIARFGKQVTTDASGLTTIRWNELGNGYMQMSIRVKLDNNRYFRLRGTHHALGDPKAEIDANGNPLVDPFGQNTASKAFEDLWFYSNPIFVEKSDWNNVSAPVSSSQSDGMIISTDASRDELTVSFSEPQTGTINLFDASGRCLLQSNMENSISEQFPLTSLSKGIYILKTNRYSQKIRIE
jgi:hypothetical protein